MTARGRERGFALLVVLWALVFISLLVMRLTAAGSGEARLASNLRAAAIAEADADGAFAEACVRLMASHGGWSLAGGTHALAVAGGQAVVTVANEAGKVDLNNASSGLLASLAVQLGADPEAAGTLANAILVWRSTAAPAQLAALDAPYRRAGRSYGPPGEPFQSVGELELVAGMSPALMGRLAPHLTVYGLGDPVLALADPVVRRAAVANGAAEPAATTAADLDGDDVVTLRVTATAAGARVTRRGVVQLEAGANGAPYRVLEWSNGAPDAD